MPALARAPGWLPWPARAQGGPARGVREHGSASLRLTNAEARGYADMMIAMHSAAQQRQQTLLQRKGITPEENTLSTMLRQESDAIVAALSAAPSPVDLAYLQAQVAVHEKVLNALDEVLIPSATDAELKADLTTARGEVSMHLELARSMLGRLNASGDAGVADAGGAT
jgi:putative membrane protein